MADRVKTGDQIKIKAETWNSVLEAADANKWQGQRTIVARAVPINTSTVRVINVSASAMDQYAAVAVTGVFTPPDPDDDNSDATLEFTANTLLKVSTPTSASTGRFLILNEPLAVNGIGTAIGVGVTPCWINMQNTTDLNVDVVASSTVPASGSSGAEILWVAGGAGSATSTGEQYSVIRLGGGSGDDGFWVRISSESPIIGNDGRYTYAGKKQSPYVAGQKRDSTTDTATVSPIYNSVECNNDGVGIEGNSADVGADGYPDGTQVVPIQGNPVLWCRPDVDCYGNRIYYVQYENAMPSVGCS